MKEKGYYYSHDECKNKFNFIKNKKCKVNNAVISSLIKLSIKIIIFQKKLYLILVNDLLLLI